LPLIDEMAKNISDNPVGWDDVKVATTDSAESLQEDDPKMTSTDLSGIKQENNAKETLKEYKANGISPERHTLVKPLMAMANTTVTTRSQHASSTRAVGVTNNVRSHVTVHVTLHILAEDNAKATLQENNAKGASTDSAVIAVLDS
ncbi:hypothetical protein M9458_055231, partial [Cirrhinus mrigala]